jgi:hypothetical protein
VQVGSWQLICKSSGCDLTEEVQAVCILNPSGKQQHFKDTATT